LTRSDIGAYFAYDLGAQPKYDKTKPERERASISGEQDSAVLSRLLAKFIREVSVRFSLCSLSLSFLSFVTFLVSGDPVPWMWPS
jgi:hypothetical protein